MEARVTKETVKKNETRELAYKSTNVGAREQADAPVETRTEFTTREYKVPVEAHKQL